MLDLFLRQFIFTCRINRGEKMLLSNTNRCTTHAMYQYEKENTRSNCEFWNTCDCDFPGKQLYRWKAWSPEAKWISKKSILSHCQVWKFYHLCAFYSLYKQVYKYMHFITKFKLFLHYFLDILARTSVTHLQNWKSLPSVS